MDYKEASVLFKLLSNELNILIIKELVACEETNFFAIDRKFKNVDSEHLIDHLQILMDHELILAYQENDDDDVIFKPNREKIDLLLSFIYSGEEEFDSECCEGEECSCEHDHHDCDDDCCCDCDDGDDEEEFFSGEGADLEEDDDPSDPNGVLKK